MVSETKHTHGSTLVDGIKHMDVYICALLQVVIQLFLLLSGAFYKRNKPFLLKSVQSV